MVMPQDGETQEQESHPPITEAQAWEANRLHNEAVAGPVNPPREQGEHATCAICGAVWPCLTHNGGSAT